MFTKAGSAQAKRRGKSGRPFYPKADHAERVQSACLLSVKNAAGKPGRGAALFRGQCSTVSPHFPVSDSVQARKVSSGETRRGEKEVEKTAAAYASTSRRALFTHGSNRRRKYNEKAVKNGVIFQGKSVGPLKKLLTLCAPCHIINKLIPRTIEYRENLSKLVEKSRSLVERARLEIV